MYIVTSHGHNHNVTGMSHMSATIARHDLVVVAPNPDAVASLFKEAAFLVREYGDLLPRDAEIVIHGAGDGRNVYSIECTYSHNGVSPHGLITVEALPDGMGEARVTFAPRRGTGRNSATMAIARDTEIRAALIELLTLVPSTFMREVKARLIRTAREKRAALAAVEA